MIYFILAALFCLALAFNLNYSIMRRLFSVTLRDAEQLWVLDSVPGVVSPEDGSGEVEQVLETLQTLPSPIPSRK